MLEVEDLTQWDDYKTAETKAHNAQLLNERRGGAESDYCPSGGYAWLTDKWGTTHVLATRCKVWKCLGCRERVKALLRMRIERGCLALGQCYLITVTLRVDRRSGEGAVRNGVWFPSGTKDAAFVNTAWRALLDSMRGDRQLRKIAWVKVPEVTQAGQPHLHVVAGGFGTMTTAETHCENHPHEYGRSWRDKRCTCLEHRVSRWWRHATNSWVVDVRPADGPKGAAGYLVKYVVKGMYVRQKLEALGFKRRWSRSRNWPAGEGLRLQGTEEDAWWKVSWRPENVDRELARKVSESGKDHRLLVRVGDDLSLALAEKREKRGALVRIEKYMEEHR